MHDKPKLAHTVGELIRELSKLPEDLKLGDPMRPVHYNKSPSAKKMRLPENVGFDNHEEY